MASGSLQLVGNTVKYDSNATPNSIPLRDANGGLTNGPEVVSLFTSTGPVVLKWNAQTASYAMSAVAGGDFAVYMDCTGGNRTVTLPAPGTLNAGQHVFVVKKDATVNMLTVLPNGGETINGAASLVLTGLATQACIWNDGTNWVAAILSPSRLIVPVGAPPTAAAGSNAGTSPPAPVVAATSSDTRGSLTFGTGTTPAAGNMAVVTFAVPFAVAPIVALTEMNAVTAALSICVTSVSTTGFTIGTSGAPAGSQANTVYAVNWHVIQ